MWLAEVAWESHFWQSSFATQPWWCELEQQEMSSEIYVLLLA